MSFKTRSYVFWSMGIWDNVGRMQRNWPLVEVGKHQNKSLWNTCSEVWWISSHFSTDWHVHFLSVSMFTSNSSWWSEHTTKLSREFSVSCAIRDCSKSGWQLTFSACPKLSLYYTRVFHFASSLHDNSEQLWEQFSGSFWWGVQYFKESQN